MSTTRDDESTDWKEAMLAGALHELHGERPPDLTAAILAHTGQRPRPRAVATPAAPAPRSWAAAALVVLSAGAVFAVAFAARDAALSQGADKRLVPLEPGAVWVYGVDRGGTVTELTQRAMAVFPLQPAGEKEPRTVGQMLVQDGGDIGFEYLAIDARGVYRAGSARRPALPGFDPAAPMTRLVALPVGSENRWETEEQQWRAMVGAGAPGAGGFGGGRGGGAGAGGLGGAGGAGGAGGGGVMRAAGGAPGGGGVAAGRTQRVVERRRVELVAPTVTIKVPAGEFQAAHVRLSPAAAEGGHGTQVVEQLWIAAGTGIVKRVLEQDGKVVETAELRSFTPGAPDPDPKAVLAKFLQRDAGVTEFGSAKATDWIEQSPSHLRLRGRFAVVTFTEKRKVFWVHGNTVTPFDPVDAEQWTSVLRDEGMTGWNDGLLPQTRCTALGDLATRLFAAQRGWKVGDQVESSSFRAGPEGASMQLVSRCVDGEGVTQRLTAKFAVGNDDRVGKVEFPE